MERPEAAGAEAASLPPSNLDLLRLLAEGSCGSLFLALGEGGLRTKELTCRLDDYAPRSVYRHAAKLLRAGLVERREEEEGVPSTVVYRLTRPAGRALFKLLVRHAGSLGRPSLDQEAWGTLLLLGELWERGWTEQLSRGSRSTTELAERADGMSFHQASRRVQLMRENGMLREVGAAGRSTRYQLTTQALRGLAVTLDLARWRQHHLAAPRSAGVNVPEVIATLAAWLPQLEVDGRSGAAVTFGVVGTLGPDKGKGSETLTGTIGEERGTDTGGQGSGEVAAWVAGTTDNWLSALLDGELDQMRVGGDVRLASSCLRQLHAGLGAAKPRA